MNRTSLARLPCSIARTVDLLGDWWTPLVLREAFYGIRRFDDFQQSLGLARTTLTSRLNRLVTEGLMEKVPYNTAPLRYEYVLTEKGRDFFGVLVAMNAWGDRWLAGPDGPPVTLRHLACDHVAVAEVRCSHCGELLTADTTRMRMGPGYPKRLARRADVRARFSGP